MKFFLVLVMLWSAHSLYVMVPKRSWFGTAVARRGDMANKALRDGLHMTSLSDKETLYEFNDIGVRRAVEWDVGQSAFVPSRSVALPIFRASLWRIFVNTFVPPEQMNEDYYNFTYWRMSQRLLSATTSVFGTQSLLMALGVKQNKLGIAAATTWVLKDALGKCSRMFWASQNGRRFDVDAKRWRFRSALLYAMGNALEIFTFICPPLFLVTAATANALKQMAMLTSSATRNAIYKSFARNANNIGDITAKGEAQIAVIDLLGMFIGVTVSKYLGMSRFKIVAAFLLLSMGDIYCIYNEIRSVCFASLNYERTTIVLDHVNRIIDSGELDGTHNGKLPMPSPKLVAREEKLLLGTKRDEYMFKTWSTMKGKGQLARMKDALEVFRGKNGSDDSNSVEVCSGGENCTSSNWSSSSSGGRGGGIREKYVVTLDVTRTKGQWELDPQIFLHPNATHFDVFRALVLVHRADWLFSQRARASVASAAGAFFGSENVHVDESLKKLLQESYDFERKHTRDVVNGLRTVGWDMGRFTYGSIQTRVEWPTDELDLPMGSS